MAIKSKDKKGTYNFYLSNNKIYINFKNTFTQEKEVQNFYLKKLSTSAIERGNLAYGFHPHPLKSSYFSGTILCTPLLKKKFKGRAQHVIFIEKKIFYSKVDGCVDQKLQ